MAISFSPGFARTLSMLEFIERAKRLLGPAMVEPSVAIKPLRRRRMRGAPATEVASPHESNADV